MDGAAIDGAVEAGADADGAVEADGGSDGGNDAAASWTVKVNWPRSMSPSSADAEVHLIVYVPSERGGGWSDIALAAVASPVPMAAPSGPSSRNELFAGSRFSEKASLIVVGEASRTSPVGGIRRDELGVGEGGRGAGEGQEQGGRERRVDRPAGDDPGGWATRTARLGDASDTHGCGV